MKIGFGGVLGLILAAFAGWLVWRNKDNLAKVFTQDLNPASDQNLAYKGVNSIVQVASL